MVKITHQTFVYYVYLLPDIKFTGFVASQFDIRKLIFATQKSPYELSKKIQF